jgi:hypothetical protein
MKNYSYLNESKMITSINRKITAFVLLLISSVLSSCSVVGGIFKAGMGFGIFIVIAVIVAIIAVFVWLGKSKS